METMAESFIISVATPKLSPSGRNQSPFDCDDISPFPTFDDSSLLSSDSIETENESFPSVATEKQREETDDDDDDDDDETSDESSAPAIPEDIGYVIDSNGVSLLANLNQKLLEHRYGKVRGAQASENTKIDIDDALSTFGRMQKLLSSRYAEYTPSIVPQASSSSLKSENKGSSPSDKRDEELMKIVKTLTKDDMRVLYKAVMGNSMPEEAAVDSREDKESGQRYPPDPLEIPLPSILEESLSGSESAPGESTRTKPEDKESAKETIPVDTVSKGKRRTFNFLRKLQFRNKVKVLKATCSRRGHGGKRSPTPESGTFPENSLQSGITNDITTTNQDLHFLEAAENNPSIEITEIPQLKANDESSRDVMTPTAPEPISGVVDTFENEVAIANNHDVEGAKNVQPVDVNEEQREMPEAIMKPNHVPTIEQVTSAVTEKKTDHVPTTESVTSADAEKKMDPSKDAASDNILVSEVETPGSPTLDPKSLEIRPKIEMSEDAIEIEKAPTTKSKESEAPIAIDPVQKKEKKFGKSLRNRSRSRSKSRSGKETKSTEKNPKNETPAQTKERNPYVPLAKRHGARWGSPLKGSVNGRQNPSSPKPSPVATLNIIEPTPQESETKMKKPTVKSPKTNSASTLDIIEPAHHESETKIKSPKVKSPKTNSASSCLKSMPSKINDVGKTESETKPSNPSVLKSNSKETTHTRPQESNDKKKKGNNISSNNLDKGASTLAFNPIESSETTTKSSVDDSSLVSSKKKSFDWGEGETESMEDSIADGHFFCGAVTPRTDNDFLSVIERSFNQVIDYLDTPREACRQSRIYDDIVDIDFEDDRKTKTKKTSPQGSDEKSASGRSRSSRKSTRSRSTKSIRSNSAKSVRCDGAKCDSDFEDDRKTKTKTTSLRGSDEKSTSGRSRSSRKSTRSRSAKSVRSRSAKSVSSKRSRSKSVKSKREKTSDTKSRSTDPTPVKKVSETSPSSEKNTKQSSNKTHLNIDPRAPATLAPTRSTPRSKAAPPKSTASSKKSFAKGKHGDMNESKSKKSSRSTNRFSERKRTV